VTTAWQIVTGLHMPLTRLGPISTGRAPVGSTEHSKFIGDRDLYAPMSSARHLNPDTFDLNQHRFDSTICAARRMVPARWSAVLILTRSSACVTDC